MLKSLVLSAAFVSLSTASFASEKGAEGQEKTHKVEHKGGHHGGKHQEDKGPKAGEHKGEHHKGEHHKGEHKGEGHEAGQAEKN